MLEFEKSDCSCIMCGAKDRETEIMRIMRNRGDNLLSFSVCKECQVIMWSELDSHTRGLK